MSADRSYWIPVDLYPVDARLRVLLVSERHAAPQVRAVPMVGCRQLGNWYLKLLDRLEPVPAHWMVTGWQPIQYEADSTVTDDQIRESFVRDVRVSAKGSVYLGDVVGWFRKTTAPRSTQSLSFTPLA